MVNRLIKEDQALFTLQLSTERKSLAATTMHIAYLIYQWLAFNAFERTMSTTTNAYSQVVALPGVRASYNHDEAYCEWRFRRTLRTFLRNRLPSTSTMRQTMSTVVFSWTVCSEATVSAVDQVSSFGGDACALSPAGTNTKAGAALLRRRVWRTRRLTCKPFTVTIFSTITVYISPGCITLPWGVSATGGIGPASSPLGKSVSICAQTSVVGLVGVGDKLSFCTLPFNEVTFRAVSSEIGLMLPFGLPCLLSSSARTVIAPTGVGEDSLMGSRVSCVHWDASNNVCFCCGQTHRCRRDSSDWQTQ